MIVGLFWTNLVLLGLLLLSITGKVLFFWRHLKRKTYAAVLNADKTTAALIPISKKTETFVYEEGEYNVPPELRTFPKLKHGSKNYVLYKKGGADPIDPFSTENSRLSAETYNAIMRNRYIRMLNRPKGMLDGINKKYLMYAAIGGIALYIVYTRFG